MSALTSSKSSAYLRESTFLQKSTGIQRSRSEVVVSRGFKPSDVRNPTKTKILTDLSQRIWGRALEASGHKVNFEDGLHSKPIDLEKLFTPASDSGEITPSRNRKMYASSSFYGPNHPTMEEQVELARRISHSLSDISNKESKGQSMYVNRKKRSVKWVHQGEGQASETETENRPPWAKESKPPLKLVMNPRGQVQDLTMLRKQGVAADPNPLSPDVCFDLVRDLNAPKGKGAELFAKRRKRSENWIIDENNVKTPENVMTQHPLSKLPPPSYLQGSAQRVENTQKMNQIQERFNQPRIKMIKSPWEAALEGSVENAFQEMSQSPRGFVTAPTPTALKRLATPPPPSPPVSTTPDLYKPKAPRAWNPQPTCKTFSSVKLDKIFAGSAKSPVSIAYHPDTDTISSEPVIIENIPPIATQLYGYEILNEAVLHEPKARRPDQFLIYEPIITKASEAKCGMMCEEREIRVSEMAPEQEFRKNGGQNGKKQPSWEEHEQVSQQSTSYEAGRVQEILECSEESRRVKESSITQSQMQSEYSQMHTKEEIQMSTEFVSGIESQGTLQGNSAVVQSNRNLQENQKNERFSDYEESQSIQSATKTQNQGSTNKMLQIPKEGSPSVTHEELDSNQQMAAYSHLSVQQTKREELEQIDKYESYIEREERLLGESLIEETIVDEEVQDLCEREFNALSLEYEKVDKPEIKKPAAEVPGAVPIFKGVDFPKETKPEPPFEVKKVDIPKHEEKKTFRKPGYAVPGAKPLFGTAMDIHVALNDAEGDDKPYEKIPVKNLINTFELSTRPVMKYKQMQDRIPPALSPNRMTSKEPERKKESEQISYIESEQSYTQQTYSGATYDTVQENLNNMSEEEIQRIHQHYELQKHKKEIYDQQMQKYKEEMKQLIEPKSKPALQSSATQKHETHEYTTEEVRSSQLSVTSQCYNVEERKREDLSRSKEEVKTTPSYTSQHSWSGSSSLPPTQASYMPLQHLQAAPAVNLSYPANNYNTAPRGWQKSMSFYRPVTFNTLQQPTYTDF